jgi:uroporphyrin-III C-methyltransferase
VTVYLVGAGPGDPELLTRRGARLLVAADVVVADRLIDPRMLAEIRDDALVIDVGKHPRTGAASTEQAEINRILIEHGRRGALVVRLKGGDPFVLGRGAEEVAALESAGVPVEVVPGVSSAFAVPALAGVPVTHRGVASVVTVASGHEIDPAVLAPLAKVEGTLVLLMAVANRGAIADVLIGAGRPRDTPVAVIEWGSSARERRTATTLAGLGAVVVEAPGVIVIGQVASMVRVPATLATVEKPTGA